MMHLLQKTLAPVLICPDGMLLTLGFFLNIVTDFSATRSGLDFPPSTLFFRLQYTFSRLPYRMWALVVMFFRFVTSGEIRRRAEFFEPFIQGMSNMSVVQVGFSLHSGVLQAAISNFSLRCHFQSNLTAVPFLSSLYCCGSEVHHLSDCL